jgi:ABC-type sugar transport system ATPase subunit
MGSSNSEEARELIDALDRYRRAIEMTAHAVALGVDVMGGSGAATATTTAVMRWWKKKEPAKPQSDVSNSIREERRKLEGKLKRLDSAVVVLIDELDRVEDEDVRKLLEVLHRLADQGNTVVVIEHNLDVIKTADWVIDLGPGGGVNGGRIIAEGVPEAIAKAPLSATGMYLKPMLERASVKPVVVEVAPKRPKRTRKVAIEEPDLIAAK